MGQWRGTRLPVVVGVDGSASALRAVQWAAREARRRSTPLQVIGATGRFGEFGFGVTMLGSGGEAVTAAAGTAAGAAPGIEVSERVVDGLPVPVLAAASCGAELVVLGDRGLGGFTALAVGSVAIRLAAQANCPVVVVRGKGTVDAGPVVVGIDGSPVSEAALAFAFEAADEREVPLVAVHTWADGALVPPVAPLLDWDAVEADERLLLGERLAGWREKHPDVAVRRVVVRDRPAHALIEEATDAAAQLVVVGSHGRGTAAGFVLGSVGHALLHHAPCPVAVVRPEP
jgi:nucleotide-binding universal stress UspA family protein